jgi:acyl carrier protein
MPSPRSSAALSQDRVLRDVIDVLAEQMGRVASELKPADSLRDDLGCDSLDLVEISMLLEEQFEIEIPNDFAEEIETIGQVTDGVLRLLQPPPRA